MEHDETKKVEAAMILERILLVEDETDIQEIARLALEAFGGFCVETCSNGRDALATAHHFQPDLFLLDVMMADMDGPTTLQELRRSSQFSQTPVIFMTAKAQPNEIAWLRSLGALDVIAKPFDPLTLSQTINELWHENLAASLLQQGNR